MAQRAGERRVNRGGNQAEKRQSAFRIATMTTLVVAVVGIGIAVILAIVNSSSRVVAAAEADPQPRAPGAIDFQPTHAMDAGRVEGLPASAPLPEGDNPDLLAVGTEPPDFNLISSTGSRVSLSALKGKTVLLEFSATWCPHCQAEAPHLKKILNSLPREEFVMISVNADSEDAASLEAYDKYFGISSPNLLDPGTRAGNFYHQGSTGPVTLQYKVAVFPTFYIISPRGRISWRADHEQPDALLLEKLKDAAAS